MQALTKAEIAERYPATQIVVCDTIHGPSPFVFPAGWTFDDTAKRLWLRMRAEVFAKRELEAKPRPIKRDILIADNRIEALGIVMANAIGMASFYWVKAAHELADVGVKESRS